MTQKHPCSEIRGWNGMVGEGPIRFEGRWGVVVGISELHALQVFLFNPYMKLLRHRNYQLYGGNWFEREAQ